MFLWHVHWQCRAGRVWVVCRYWVIISSLQKVADNHNWLTNLLEDLHCAHIKTDDSRNYVIFRERVRFSFAACLRVLCHSRCCFLSLTTSSIQQITHNWSLWMESDGLFNPTDFDVFLKSPAHHYDYYCRKMSDEDISNAADYARHRWRELSHHLSARTCCKLITDYQIGRTRFIAKKEESAQVLN